MQQTSTKFRNHLVSKFPILPLQKVKTSRLRITLKAKNDCELFIQSSFEFNTAFTYSDGPNNIATLLAKKRLIDVMHGVANAIG